MGLALQVTVFIATSLDGYIARANGDLDWLPGSPDAGEDYGYGALMASVDGLVMGRKTYEKVRTFGEWPYGEKPVIVLSRRPEALAGVLPPRVEVWSGEPAEVATRLVERGWHHAYVDGGATIQGFLAAGLVDRLIVSRIPVLLGEGIPLFGRVPRDIRLEHCGTRAYASGLVQSEYRVGSLGG